MPHHKEGYTLEDGFRRLQHHSKRQLNDLRDNPTERTVCVGSDTNYDLELLSEHNHSTSLPTF